MLKKIAIAVVCILFLATSAFALGSFTATWTAVTLNTDGTPITDLAGYRLYYGTSHAIYTSTVTLGIVTTATVTGLADGRYYVVVTAFDTEGLESDYSPEVYIDINTGRPKAPAAVSIPGGLGYV